MKIGDSVRIKENSKYYGQDVGVGVIFEEVSSDPGWYEVYFSSGYRNQYTLKDLELANWDK